MYDCKLGNYDISNYHLQIFNDTKISDISELVMADDADTICVIRRNSNGTCIVPFKLEVNPFKISDSTEDDNMLIICQLPWLFQVTHYNPHNNSLILMARDGANRPLSFITI